MAKQIPDSVQVAIVGGGIVGVATAYHLARAGWSVAVFERRKLTSGTTWHAAGLVSETQAVPTMSALAKYGLDLMESLEAETGQVTGFRRNGSITLALHADRMEELRRKVAYAHGCGLEASEISLEEAVERWPHLSTEGAAGAVWFPGDGFTNPIDVTMAMAKGARNAGAQIFEDCKVERLVMEGGRVAGVETAQGMVRAETVVNATGMWGRDFALGHDVALPLHTCNHYYVVTEPIEGLSPDLPVLRVMDEYAYYKEDAGKLLIGCSEPDATAWNPEGGIPDHFEFDELPCEEEHLYDILGHAAERVPVLAETGIRKFFNGPECFTPDGLYYLGPVLDKPGLFVAAGFNSTGIQNGPGAGKALAEWIMQGHMPTDLTDVDVRRVNPRLNAPAYVSEKAAETLSLAYAMHWPNYQRESARGLRRTPYFADLKARGAAFGTASGWERPVFFGTDEVAPDITYGFGEQPWHRAWKGEHKALREDLGLIDLTFGRFLVQGPEAEACLQRLCANDAGLPPGALVYTPMLNAQGGMEADVTVARLGEDSYMVMASAGAEPQTESWLRFGAKDFNVTIANVTSGEATLALMGPRSRDFLSGLTDVDLSDTAFPFGSFQQIFVGCAPVRAQRITYVGELGWELHVPSEFASFLLENLLEADGAPRLCGGMAVDSCRVEKGFRHWGHDIGPFDSPVEAGMTFACALDKPGGFIGRDAVLAKRQAGASHRMLQFHLADPDAYLFGKEPIRLDGEIVGRVTSASRSWTLGGAMALGYVSRKNGMSWKDLAAADFEIPAGGELFSAKASLKPFYDPSNVRMRG